MEPRARFELAFPDYRSGASPTMLTGPGNSGANGANRTLIGCLPCNCSPVELHRLGARGGNRNPDLRVTSAVLFHLSYSGASKTLERVRRIELRLSDRRSDAQPIGHTRRNSGADGDNRNLFSGLEAQGTPYIPRPLIKDFRDAIQLSKTCIETHFYCVASKRKRVRQNASNYR